MSDNTNFNYYPTAPGSVPGLAQRPRGNALAVTGFVLSLLGLGFLVPLFGWLVIPFVILGLVLSIVAFLRTRNGFTRRGLALAGIVISGLTLIAGLIINLVTYHTASRDWTMVDTTLPAPTGAQAEALVGDWAFDGAPWFRFNADGTGENLSDGEHFNWHGDGSFSNASAYRSWVVNGDTLTVTWITGNSFDYTRISN